jgi:hypothetical protein
LQFIERLSLRIRIFLEMSAEPSELLEASADPPRTLVDRFELPRLRVHHLLAWMAATAVTFAAYQLEVEGAKRLDANLVSPNTPAITALGAAQFIAAGGSLFISAAVLYWRMCGYCQRLQPGHWLAMLSLAEWTLNTVGMLLFFPGASSAALRWMVRRLLQMAAWGITLIWPAWLAARPGQAPRWRCAFAAIPVGRLLVFFGPMRTTVDYQIVSAGVQATALMVALAGDLKDFRDRHWSHWIGASMRLLACLAIAALVSYWAIFPDVFSSP